jgi:glycosyltransferase involved in cell wall biosynthesis
MMAQVCFWTSLGVILYVYAGYPLALLILSLFRHQVVLRGPITPSVSFIITGYNEEGRIKEKLENTLQQDYPKDKLQIIVASDCSQDKTDEIVGSYASRGVHLVRLHERRGKESAQKQALERASGEILVFSDVATILPEDGTSQIVQNFADPTVGCVSSVDRFLDVDGKVSGESAYVRYEMFLRQLESRVNTLVGLSGSFFAARREVCRNWAVDLPSDFNTLLNAVRMGYRGISDPKSVGYYKNIFDEQREFDRKIRTVLRGISVLMKSLAMLNPFRYGLFAWQLFSHKLGRWLIPFGMIGAFCSNALLLGRSASFVATFMFQIGFYGLAFLGLTRPRLVHRAWLKIPSFFVLANLSILKAWYLYFIGQRAVAWEPSKR